MRKKIEILQGLVAGGKKLFDLAKGQGDKGSKVSTTITGTTPKVGSLTKRRKDVDEIFGIRTRHGIAPNKKTAETVKKVSKLNDELDKIKNRTRKASGGRIGLKRGTGLMKKKSNVEKIKKTFGPKKGLGMQSVIYGLDKNPKITAADPKAKFIAAANKKKKKKVI